MGIRAATRIARLASLCLFLLYLGTTTRILHLQQETTNRSLGVGMNSNKGLSSTTHSNRMLHRHNFRRPSTEVGGTNTTAQFPPKQSHDKPHLKLNQIYGTNQNISADERNLWELSDCIPAPIKEYLDWHSQTRQSLTLEMFRSGMVRILVWEETQGRDYDANDMATHLATLPFLIQVAMKTNRLLLIHWTVPVILTDFLVPPVSGIDWRCPQWLEQKWQQDPSFGFWIDKADEKEIVALTRATPKYLSFISNMSDTTDTLWNAYSNMFHELWRLFFVPSKIVEKNIYKAFRSNQGMNPGEYTTIHLHSRAISFKDVIETARSALDCGLQIQSKGPFLVRSDDSKIVLATTTVGDSKSVYTYTTEPLQIETPLRYFVEVYLMAMGTCTVSNESSGLQLLASMIGNSSTCLFDVSGSCPVDQVTKHLPPKTDRNMHYLGKEMPEKGTDYTIDVSFKPTKGPSSLPKWILEYFSWHKQIKHNLNENNWNMTKYLILGCLEYHKSCGGVSDRLKPLPMILLEAFRHKRLLLIWWERPRPLEDFLVPPPDGLDWVVQPWLKDKLKQTLGHNALGSSTVNFEQGKALLKGGHFKTAVLFKMQTPSAGEDLFHAELRNQNPSESDNDVVSVASRNDGTTYADVFHELFRHLFNPVPRIQHVLDERMNKHHLIPGEYAAVHLRALYGKRDTRDIQETVDLAVLGVNCASNLYPGGQIYFASDTTLATDAAAAYANMHNLPVITMSNSQTTTNTITSGNPIHLDKDSYWKTRDASAYDSTFVDLYLLAQSRCIAYSNGGYGTFGSLLSYDAKCKMRFFKGNHKIKACVWMSADRKRHNLALPNATTLFG